MVKKKKIKIEGGKEGKGENVCANQKTIRHQTTQNFVKL
jgi:hypothetical protein